VHRDSPSPIPPILGTIISFLSMNLPALDTSYKWSHMVCDTFWVWLVSLSLMCSWHFWEELGTCQHPVPFLVNDTIVQIGQCCFCIHSRWGWGHFGVLRSDTPLSFCICIGVDTHFHFSWVYMLAGERPIHSNQHGRHSHDPKAIARVVVATQEIKQRSQRNFTSHWGYGLPHTLTESPHFPGPSVFSEI
jgi:hypothetical protein